LYYCNFFFFSIRKANPAKFDDYLARQAENFMRRKLCGLPCCVPHPRLPEHATHLARARRSLEQFDLVVAVVLGHDPRARPGSLWRAWGEQALGWRDVACGRGHAARADESGSSRGPQTGLAQEARSERVTFDNELHTLAKRVAAQQQLRHARRRQQQQQRRLASAVEDMVGDHDDDPAVLEADVQQA
jgi:hypothetical protein